MTFNKSVEKNEKEMKIDKKNSEELKFMGRHHDSFSAALHHERIRCQNSSGKAPGAEAPAPGGGNAVPQAESNKPEEIVVV